MTDLLMDFPPLLKKSLQVETIEVKKLKPFAKNARSHSDKQIKQLARSIEKFGFNNPVLVDEKLNIIAGHGRVLAAQQLQLKDIPTIKLLHLTDKQKRAFMLADNKIAENSSWDTKLLNEQIELLRLEDFDLSDIGFEPPELIEAPERKEKGETTKTMVCPHCLKAFEC